MTEPPAVLLYDGDCGFCNATVQFFLERTTADSLLFAPLQSEFARQRLREHGVHDPDLRVAYLLTGQRLHAASSAILEALRFVQGSVRHLSLLRVVPAPIRDGVYRVIATHRTRLMPQSECRVPLPHERRRFVA